MRLPPLIGVALLCLAGSAHGSETNTAASDEQAFLSDLPMVLTPSRLLQPLNEAPAAVTVIDRKLIQATGYRDIPRLLRLVPGIQVGQERGGTHWVNYHGMSNNIPSLIQVLVDGRSAYSSGDLEGVDWSGLPVSLDEIERIEIVRGTNSVAYGSNAFLGVVNIITRHSTDNSGTKAEIRAGNARIRDGSLELNNDMAGGGMRLNAEIKHDDGFDGLHDAKLFKLATLRGDWGWSNHDELMVRLAASSSSRELGYPDSTFNNNGERGSDSLNTTLHIQWRHTPSSAEEWLLNYYRNHDRANEEWIASATLGPVTAVVPLNRNRSNMRDNLELQYRQAMSDRLRIVLGGEVRSDRMDSPFLFYGATRQDSRLGRLFGQAEWRFRPDWILNASALAEKFDDDSLHFSPRLFASWQTSPKDTLRFGYARAWRQPNNFERYGDVRAIYQGQLLVHPYLPNPDLLAPRIDSLEIGYLRQFKTWDTRLDARLFMERIGNYIYRVPHPENPAPLLSGILPSARYENLASPVTLRGLEYQIESRPHQGARLLFSHTMIDRASSDPAITRLTAPYTASLSWFQDWEQNWSSSLTLLRMGPVAGGIGFVPMSQYVSRPYTTLDTRLAYHTKYNGIPAEIALTGTNLGGRHQEIPDRSEQFLHGSDPVNLTSPMVWLSLTLRSK